VIAAAPPSRAFDAIVVVHALTAIAAVVVLITLRSAAAAAARGGNVPAPAMRSFTGRRELAGRVVHLVPLTGLWAVAASRGADDLATLFVCLGIALWVVAAGCLEAVAFPAQREVAVALATAGGAASARPSAVRMGRAIDGALAAVVIAAIVMVASQS